MKSNGTTYYYAVEQFMTTFDNKPPYSHREEFRAEDLLSCRRDAFKYYNSQDLAAHTKGTFYDKQFKTPSEGFEMGSHAAHSLTLILIECPPLDSEEIEHIILGEDDETISDGQRTEFAVFKGMGIDINKENRIMKERGYIK
jgi:hypothetical protein